MPTNILNPDERQQLTSIPTEIDEADLARFFTLEVGDMKLIDRRDGPEQRLDQAAHIGLLRWLGWSPVRVDRLPQVALLALCGQLQIETPNGLNPPAERTSRKHARLAREHLGWHKYTADTERTLAAWLEPRAAEKDRGGLLLNALLQHLYREKIVRPGLSRLERLVATVRAVVNDEIAQTVSSQLSEKQKEHLDTLLVVPAGETLSPWQRLKDPPSGASRNVLLDILQKIESIRALKLDALDLSKVPPNRIKLLAQRARRRTNWTTSRLKPERRYLLLVCFLDQTLPKLVDVAVDLHNKLTQSIFTRAESRRNEEVAKRGQSLNNKVLLLAQLGHMILDEKSIPDMELRAAIYRRISRGNLAQTVQECDAIAQPADYTAFSYADGSYSHLRVFGPKFLRSIRVQAEEKGRADAVLEAVKFMQAVDAGERTFEEPPLEFVPWQWRAYVGGEDEEPVNHRMYQLCLHKCLVRALENGDLWVPGSREYVSFRHEWIADEVWPVQRKTFLEHYPHLADANVFLEEAKVALDAKMIEVNAVWPELKEQVWIGEDGNLHVARLDADETPPGTDKLREQLTRLFPRVDIAQLLLEVNHWVGVDQLLTNINEQERQVRDLVIKKTAVLMAEGLNIGLQNMSHCLSKTSYHDLAGTYDRYFREETLRKALVAVVNLISHSHCTSYNGLVIMV